jgi:hypothetical protein
MMALPWFVFARAPIGRFGIPSNTRAPENRAECLPAPVKLSIRRNSCAQTGVATALAAGACLPLLPWCPAPVEEIQSVRRLGWLSLNEQAQAIERLNLARLCCTAGSSLIFAEARSARDP